MTRRRLSWAVLLAVVLLLGAALGRTSAGLASPPAPVPPPQASSMTPPQPTVPAPRAITPTVAVPAASSVPAHGGVSDAALVVTGPPSVSDRAVDAVLSRESSPLAGLGPYIVAEGRRQGIDPVFLLAIVSYFDVRDPLPAALHNVGHIRAKAGEPAVDGYRAYPTWRAGIAAWYALIHDLYVGRWGLRTLDAIIPVYAPAPRPRLEAEIDDMRAMVGAWRLQDRQ